MTNIRLVMIKPARALLVMAASLGALVPAVGQDATPAVQKSIEATLQEQVKAWNKGDIPGFMEAYWKSESLAFSSGGQTTRGWQATLERYQARYDSREKMGHLAFSDLEISKLGDEHALVLGRWNLQAASPMEGNFSLVLMRNEKRWVIIHDHTSLLKE